MVNVQKHFKLKNKKANPIRVRDDKTKRFKKKYTVDMTIEGCFNAPAQIGEDTFKGMLKVNGVTSLYGIARGFVQSTTSQTLLSGSVLLPMFNVAAYSEDLDEQES